MDVEVETLLLQHIRLSVMTCQAVPLGSQTVKEKCPGDNRGETDTNPYSKRPKSREIGCPTKVSKLPSDIAVNVLLLQHMRRLRMTCRSVPLASTRTVMETCLGGNQSEVQETFGNKCKSKSISRPTKVSELPSAIAVDMLLLQDIILPAITCHAIPLASPRTVIERFLGDNRSETDTKSYNKRLKSNSISLFTRFAKLLGDTRVDLLLLKSTGVQVMAC